MRPLSPPLMPPDTQNPGDAPNPGVPLQERLAWLYRRHGELASKVLDGSASVAESCELYAVRMETDQLIAELMSERLR